MCRVPFKENCLRFWPLNNSFTELKGGNQMFYPYKYNRFDTDDKCLVMNDDFVLTIDEKYLPSGPMTLIFQTKELYIKDEIEIMKNRFMNSDNDVNVYSFNFKDNVKLLKNKKRWLTHVVVYEENRTVYYIDGMIASIRESGRRSVGKGITFNDYTNPDRVVCAGKLRNIGVYDIPFSYKMIRALEYFDFYKRSILNMVVNRMIKKRETKEGEQSWI